MINWVNLIKENIEKIEEALKEAYKNACGHPAVFKGFNAEECVIIDKEGNITQISKQHNETPMNVWEGNAIIVGSFDWFDPTEGESYEDEVIKAELTEQQLKQLEKFIEDNMYGSDINFAALYDFDKELYKKVYNNYVEEFIQDNIDEVINNTINHNIEQLEMWQSIQY